MAEDHGWDVEELKDAQAGGRASSVHMTFAERLSMQSDLMQGFQRGQVERDTDDEMEDNDTHDSTAFATRRFKQEVNARVPCLERHARALLEQLYSTALGDNTTFETLLRWYTSQHPIPEELKLNDEFKLDVPPSEEEVGKTRFLLWLMLADETLRKIRIDDQHSIETDPRGMAYCVHGNMPRPSGPTDRTDLSVSVLDCRVNYQAYGDGRVCVIQTLADGERIGMNGQIGSALQENVLFRPIEDIPIPRGGNRPHVAFGFKGTLSDSRRPLKWSAKAGIQLFGLRRPLLRMQPSLSALLFHLYRLGIRLAPIEAAVKLAATHANSRAPLRVGPFPITTATHGSRERTALFPYQFWHDGNDAAFANRVVHLCTTKGIKRSILLHFRRKIVSTPDTVAFMQFFRVYWLSVLTTSELKVNGPDYYGYADSDPASISTVFAYDVATSRCSVCSLREVHMNKGDELWALGNEPGDVHLFAATTDKLILRGMHSAKVPRRAMAKNILTFYQQTQESLLAYQDTSMMKMIVASVRAGRPGATADEVHIHAKISAARRYMFWCFMTSAYAEDAPLRFDAGNGSSFKVGCDSWRFTHRIELRPAPSTLAGKYAQTLVRSGQYAFKFTFRETNYSVDILDTANCIVISRQDVEFGARFTDDAESALTIRPTDLVGPPLTATYTISVRAHGDYAYVIWECKEPEDVADKSELFVCFTHLCLNMHVSALEATLSAMVTQNMRPVRPQRVDARLASTTEPVAWDSWDSVSQSLQALGLTEAVLLIHGTDTRRAPRIMCVRLDRAGHMSTIEIETKGGTISCREMQPVPRRSPDDILSVLQPEGWLFCLAMAPRHAYSLHREHTVNMTSGKVQAPKPASSDAKAKAKTDAKTEAKAAAKAKAKQAPQQHNTWTPRPVLANFRTDGRKAVPRLEDNPPKNIVLQPVGYTGPFDNGYLTAYFPYNLGSGDGWKMVGTAAVNTDGAKQDGEAKGGRMLLPGDQPCLSVPVGCQRLSNHLWFRFYELEEVPVGLAGTSSEHLSRLGVLYRKACGVLSMEHTVCAVGDTLTVEMYQYVVPLPCGEASASKAKADKQSNIMCHVGQMTFKVVELPGGTDKAENARLWGYGEDGKQIMPRVHYDVTKRSAVKAYTKKVKEFLKSVPHSDVGLPNWVTASRAFSCGKLPLWSFTVECLNGARVCQEHALFCITKLCMTKNVYDGSKQDDMLELLTDVLACLPLAATYVPDRSRKLIAGAQEHLCMGRQNATPDNLNQEYRPPPEKAVHVQYQQDDQWAHTLCSPSLGESSYDCEDGASTAMFVFSGLSAVDTSTPLTHDQQTTSLVWPEFRSVCDLAKRYDAFFTVGTLSIPAASDDEKAEAGVTYHAWLTLIDKRKARRMLFEQCGAQKFDPKTAPEFKDTSPELPTLFVETTEDVTSNPNYAPAGFDEAAYSRTRFMDPCCHTKVPGDVMSRCSQYLHVIHMLCPQYWGDTGITDFYCMDTSDAKAPKLGVPANSFREWKNWKPHIAAPVTEEVFYAAQLAMCQLPRMNLPDFDPWTSVELEGSASKDPALRQGETTLYTSTRYWESIKKDAMKWLSAQGANASIYTVDIRIFGQTSQTLVHVSPHAKAKAKAKTEQKTSGKACVHTMAKFSGIVGGGALACGHHFSCSKCIGKRASSQTAKPGKSDCGCRFSPTKAKRGHYALRHK